MINKKLFTEHEEKYYQILALPIDCLGLEGFPMQHPLEVLTKVLQSVTEDIHNMFLEDLY